MVYFVGAGTGAPDLITVRGRRYLEQADVIIYAGSLSIQNFFLMRRRIVKFLTARP